jgi:very-short-patch-repair endonuclease
MPKLSPDSVRFSRKLRTGMTDAERKLWRELRLQQFGVKFRRQHPLGKYFADFACIERMLCIEVDGAQHASTSDYDAARTAFLKSQGYRVLRFTDREVLTTIDSVKEAIWNALQDLKPPPP